MPSSKNNKNQNTSEPDMKKKLGEVYKSKWFLPAVVLLLGVISFGAFYAMATQKNPEYSKSQNCETEFCVALKSNGADPRELSVPVGSFVQFNSADNKTHNLSLGEGGDEHDHSGPFYSGEFGGDEAWKVQFKEDGSYFFHDHMNPDINVLVVVYTPGKDYKIN
jgi:plastocyanin